MKKFLLIVAAMTSAAFVAHAQQDGKTATAAPETTVDGSKAPETKKSEAKAKKPKAAAQDYKPLAAEYGKKAKCPISGEDFKVGPDTKAVKYKGKVYYFCCEGCPQKFKKNPAKYAK